MYYVHNLDSQAFEFFGVTFHWYWLFYLLGYLITLYGGEALIKKEKLPISLRSYSLVFLIGWPLLFIFSRLFYVLIYNLDYFITRPEEILIFWRGGMSFHGALLGIVLAFYIVARTQKESFFALSDVFCFFAPLTLFFGRLGNFINGELAGRVTDVPWAIIFPRLYDQQPRHPSQIYEALGEGLILFGIIFLLRKDIHKKGRISALFLMGYAFFRFFIEFFRLPDHQLGLYLGYFSMGQLLCTIMFLLGIVVYRRSKDSE